MSGVQIIERDGRPEWAVIPYADYERMLDRLEDLQDAADADAAMADLASGKDEAVPAEIANRLCGGENRIKVWRDFRELTQTQLAEAAGVAQPTIAQIENGDRQGSVAVLRKIAGALRVDLDDIA